jgi:hypothetical protein
VLIVADGEETPWIGKAASVDVNPASLLQRRPKIDAPKEVWREYLQRLIESELSALPEFRAARREARVIIRTRARR